jgi:hypothetical protein
VVAGTPPSIVVDALTTIPCPRTQSVRLGALHSASPIPSKRSSSIESLRALLRGVIFSLGVPSGVGLGLGAMGVEAMGVGSMGVFALLSPHAFPANSKQTCWTNQASW